MSYQWSMGSKYTLQGCFFSVILMVVSKVSFISVETGNSEFGG